MSSQSSDAIPNSPDELDALTGVLNRRSLYARCDELLRQSQENQTPLTLLFLDIDRLKMANACFGHTVVDQILRDFVPEIRAMVPPGCFVGRPGGNEFVVLMPNAHAEQGRTLAEAIRVAIQKSYVRGERVEHALPGQEAWVLTASIGVASLGPDNVRTRDELFKTAESAMCRAKNEGRNRVSAEPYPPKNPPV